MPRFELEHPHDPGVRAEYGFDRLPLVGWFAEVFYDQRTKPLIVYDARQSNYDTEYPLRGLLLFMVEQRFFSADELQDALDVWAAPEPVAAPSDVLRVVDVIRNLKFAADS
ncbi:MAG: hypothetical protein OXU20_15615 [Myxococcales bacterium]|nr:hypothetical protein [Myxococcales bacterium]